MPELATVVAFAFLAALLVYVIVQVPVTPEPTTPHPDDTEVLARIGARILFVDCGRRTITVDGVEVTTGTPFAIEVRAPEGWSVEEGGRQLWHWAATDAVIDLRLHDNLRGRRAWMSSADLTIDFPLAGVLGVQHSHD